MDISRMKYYKQLHGYTDEQLSELTGISKELIQRIFSGESEFPGYVALQALEKVLKPEPAEWIAEPAVPYTVKRDGEYTLEDYYALPDDQRVELIDGTFYEMNAPTTIHQIIAFQMCHQIENYIEEHEGECVPYIAPVDVQLDCDEKTMVQPDVIILCDKSKDVQRCIYGAPDFVAEVLSPSTRRKDRRLKLVKYANAGVREYWMIDPDRRQIVVQQFASFEEDDDNIRIYGFEDKIPVQIYEGDLQIDFEKISRKLER